MPVPITPSSKSARENSIATRPSPRITGVIGVSVAGVFTPPTLKPARLQLALEVTRIGPEPLDAFRFLLQDVEGRDARGGHRRRM